MIMDSKQIEALLEKYWNCETSLEEEQQLREFFRTDPVPAAWKDAAELFRYFEKQRTRGLTDSDFDTRVMMRVKNPPKGKMVNWSYVARIAAGLLVVIAAGYLVRQEIRKSYPPEDTFSDPQIAFEETKKALMMISKGFGKGNQEAKKINVFREAEHRVGKKTKKENSI
jgi:hypothetical protein